MKPQPTYATESSRWDAVQERKRVVDGAFYYAVKTTGIYCRPGCSSRLPKRENVVFFDSCQEAERAGYRQCRRCTPRDVSPQEAQAGIAERACRRLEREETPPNLSELAADAGLSPWYFQRLFKRTVGVTPKQYAAKVQAGRFRDSLESSSSVTEASYDAGYGSSSRAYESARDHLAMAPTAYREGAEGLTIQYAVTSCFLGSVIVAMTERGICAVEFGDDPDALRAQVQARFPMARLEHADTALSSTLEAVTGYIEAPRTGVDLPLDIQGTAFQIRVWNALRDIPRGDTVTYAEVARRIGKPRAARAVAQACAANKLGAVVPCHRVVRSDGTLGGYRWGLERKRALLDRERGDSRETSAQRGFVR